MYFVFTLDVDNARAQLFSSIDHYDENQGDVILDIKEDY
jgi:hypothetical protein